jgi:hypothetical protein
MSQDITTQGYAVQGLEKLINLVSKKTIYSVIVIDSPNDQGIITLNFNPPLEFNPELNYNVSLLSFSASSLFPNITTGNNKFYYSLVEPTPGGGGSSITSSRDAMKILTFDTGAYYIKDINDYLKDHISGEQITIELNAGSGKSIIKLKNNAKVYFGQYRNPENSQLVMCENTFADLLGFDRVSLTSPVNTSQRMADVIKDLMFFISVDCIDGSNNNGTYSQILFSFLNNQKYGSMINQNVKFPEKHMLRKTNKITRMIFSFTNQDGKPITFLNYKVSLKLQIEQV